MAVSLLRICGGLLCLACHAIPAPAQSAAIDDYVRAEMDRRHIPGLSLAVVRNGTVLKLGHYGLADVELNVPVTDDTKFAIASMTKQFTDAAILLLAEEGKLGLDDPVARFLSDAPPSWKAMTIRQLMNHTAGLRDDWDEDTAFFLRNQTDEDFLKALYAFPLKFPPGQAWAYSAGPFVLGVVIAKITGRPYWAFMQERVFAPLGMTATSVNDVFATLPHRASGYRWMGGAFTKGARISPAAQGRGDVGIVGTAGDLAKWDAALNTTKLLSRKSLEAMFTGATINNRFDTGSALGWFVLPWRGDQLVFHSGSFRTGFGSTHNRYVDRGLTVIVLTNQCAGGQRLGPCQTDEPFNLATGIAAHYEPEYGLIARMPPERDPNRGRTEKLFEFFTAASDGRIDWRAVADRSLNLYPVERLQGGLKGITALTSIACQDTKGRRNAYGDRVFLQSGRGAGAVLGGGLHSIRTNRVCNARVVGLHSPGHIVCSFLRCPTDNRTDWLRRTNSSRRTLSRRSSTRLIASAFQSPRICDRSRVVGPSSSGSTISSTGSGRALALRKMSSGRIKQVVRIGFVPGDDSHGDPRRGDVPSYTSCTGRIVVDKKQICKSSAVLPINTSAILTTSRSFSRTGSGTTRHSCCSESKGW